MRSTNKSEAQITLIGCTCLLLATFFITSNGFGLDSKEGKLTFESTTTTSPAATAATKSKRQIEDVAITQSSNLVGYSNNPKGTVERSILEHQEALAEECSKYHELEVGKLNHLTNGLNQEPTILDWQNPLSVKVPAICLFVFDQFSSLPEWKLTDTSGNNKDENAYKRIEFVKWIFTNDDLPVTAINSSILQHSNHNKTKRAIKGGQFLDNHSELLDASNNNSGFQDDKFNEIELDDKEKFHKDLNKIMSDNNFVQGIDANRNRLANYLSPVILVPGLLGSRIQARTTKIRRVNMFCRKKSDWHDMWLSIRQLLPLVVDCWLDNVRLEYDPNTGWSKSPIGTETRVADFGSVESVRYLDVKSPKLTKYFAPLIDTYEKLGYTVDENLLAAPYDFRLAPQEMTDYYRKLKNLIETTLDTSPSGKKITLVCHSMGCTHLLVFLRLQSPTWRQNYVRKMIALSSPWGGAIKALKALVVGDGLEMPLVSESKIRKLARTYPGMAFLLPQDEVFARTNRNRPISGGPILVQTPEKTYKSTDLSQLMQDLNLTHQFEWFKSSTSLIKPLEPLPDVYVDCIHSLNTPTAETLIFKKQTNFPDGEYELVKGDGDGTVNFESLMICEDWANQFPDKIKHKIILNTSHSGLLSHPHLITHLIDDIMMN